MFQGKIFGDHSLVLWVHYNFRFWDGVGGTADLSAAVEMTILFECSISRFQERPAELQIPFLHIVRLAE